MTNFMVIRKRRRSKASAFFFVAWLIAPFDEWLDGVQALTQKRICRNGAGMDLILILAGDFAMGSPADEKKKGHSTFPCPAGPGMPAHIFLQLHKWYRSGARRSAPVKLYQGARSIISAGTCSMIGY